MPARIAAIVVTLEGGARALACLARLTEAAPEVERILVVNGSAPPAGLDPGVTVVELADNAGYAGGANAGAAAAQARGATHLLLLNDDVLVEPGCVAALAAAAGDDKAAAPRIEAPGADAFSGARIDERRGFGVHAAGATDYLTGAALLVPCTVWDLVGPFDERLFLYYEDVDWCVRARALGVRLVVAPDARAAHATGSSTGGARGPTWAYYATRNRLWFLAGLRGRGAARREAARSAAAAVASLARGGSRAVARARLEGIADWSRGRFGRGPYP